MKNKTPPLDTAAVGLVLIGLCNALAQTLLPEMPVRQDVPPLKKLPSPGAAFDQARHC